MSFTAPPPARTSPTSTGAPLPSAIDGEDAHRSLPAWPVDAVLWGFPIWWVLGLTPFIVPIAGMVMAVLLLASTRVRVGRGLTPWFAFVAWLLPCALAVDTFGRLAGLGQRFANFAAIAVVLVYASNARATLTNRRITNGLTALWCFVIGGGMLGVLFPHKRLVTPVGLLLPASLTSNSLVHDLVFPPFAEVQQPYGAPVPFNRPSAPFPYTNGWGCAIAFLTPVAIYTLLRTRSLKVRLFLAGMLVVMVIPAVATLNRGMFIGLAIGLVYVSVRLLFRGKVLPFLAVVVVGVFAVFLFIASGTGNGIESRTQAGGRGGGTNQGRATIYEETFQRTLESPIVGYGAPRPSESLSISAGTQGFFWQVMFSYGFVGLALFLWFLWGTVWRTSRPDGTAGLWLHAVLVVASVTIFYYGIDTMQMLTLVLVAFVLQQARLERDAAAPALVTAS